MGKLRHSTYQVLRSRKQILLPELVKCIHLEHPRVRDNTASIIPCNEVSAVVWKRTIYLGKQNAYF